MYISRRDIINVDSIKGNKLSFLNVVSGSGASTKLKRYPDKIAPVLSYNIDEVIQYCERRLSEATTNPRKNKFFKKRKENLQNILKIKYIYSDSENV